MFSILELYQKMPVAMAVRNSTKFLFNNFPVLYNKFLKQKNPALSHQTLRTSWHAQLGAEQGPSSNPAKQCCALVKMFTALKVESTNGRKNVLTFSLGIVEQGLIVHQAQVDRP